MQGHAKEFTRMFRKRRSRMFRKSKGLATELLSGVSLLSIIAVVGTRPSKVQSFQTKPKRQSSKAKACEGKFRLHYRGMRLMW